MKTFILISFCLFAYNAASAADFSQRRQPTAAASTPIQPPPWLKNASAANCAPKGKPLRTRY